MYVFIFNFITLFYPETPAKKPDEKPDDENTEDDQKDEKEDEDDEKKPCKLYFFYETINLFIIYINYDN